MRHESARLCIQNVGFKRLLATTAVLGFAGIAPPADAISRATVTGAVHAVIRAVAEEGGTVMYDSTPQVHCRRTLPSRFGCSFLNIARDSLGGRVNVVYKHRHYFVSEAIYEEPRELGSPRMPCYQASGC
jgi:hypothetical protein